MNCVCGKPSIEQELNLCKECYREYHRLKARWGVLVAQ